MLYNLYAITKQNFININQKYKNIFFFLNYIEKNKSFF